MQRQSNNGKLVTINLKFNYHVSKYPITFLREGTMPSEQFLIGHKSWILVNVCMNLFELKKDITRKVYFHQFVFDIYPKKYAIYFNTHS